MKYTEKIKKYFFLGCIFFMLMPVYAQLTGIKNIPGNYATLALAITDLNAQGAGIGGVTLNLLAGNAETTPPGGYVITATGTATNTITLQGNGNTITASNLHTIGAANDAIFKLLGADYITLTGFVLEENIANTIPNPATNNMTEWGVALLYASATNGAQNNRIENNTISLNRTHTNSFGIYSNTRHTATSVTAAADITSLAGANSNNKIYANTISNVNIGIALIGSGVAAYQDSGNDIGGNAIATGNTISNWGGAATSTLFVSNSTTSYGILVNHQIGENVSYNTLSSAAVSGTSVSLRAILKAYTLTNPIGTFTSTISNNTITLSSAFTSGIFECISSQDMSVLPTATIIIDNNTLLNCSVSGVAAGSNIVGISNTSAPGNLSISNNIIKGNSSSATTGGFVGISSTVATPISYTASISTTTMTVTVIATGSLTVGQTITGAGVVSGTTITAFGTGTGGIGTYIISPSQTVGSVGMTATAFSPTIININNNHIGNVSGAAITFGAATTGVVTGITNTNGSAGAMVNINNNDFRGIVHTLTGSGAQTYISNTAIHPNTTINNNTFTNLIANTTNSVTFISNNISHIANTTHNTNGNAIVTGFNKLAAGGNVYFYSSQGSSPSSVIEINSNNNFSNITCIGTTIIRGWVNLDGATSGAQKTITNNTLNAISGGTGLITIMMVGFSDATSNNNNISGNVISNITGAGAITGIFSTNNGSCCTSAGSQNFFNNDIHTLYSTGATFVTGISITTGTNQNIYNNKIYDLQTDNVNGTVYGITLDNTIALAAGLICNIYNNIIGDLKAPITSSLTAPVRGISVNSNRTNTFKIYYNTIYLNATSTGANFSSAGIYHTTSATATIGTLDLRNNIIVNTSTANGTGLSATYRRSNATLTNFATTSNNNLFYAGVPSVNKLIFYDGTNADQTLLAYQTRMSTRDAAAISVNPIFASTTGSSASYLHLQTASNCLINAMGTVITGFTTDYNYDTRDASTPDIGADEYTPALPSITIPNPIICEGTATTLTATALVPVTFAWYDSPIGGTLLGNTANYTTPALTSTTTYYVEHTANSCTSLRNSGTVTITSPTAGTTTWLGITSTDWFTTSNWCGGIPTNTSNVIILGNTPFNPIINNIGAECNNITIDNDAILTTSNNQNLNVYGNWLLNGSYNSNTGTISFTGTANQTLGGDEPNIFYNLTLNNAGISSNDNLTLTQPLTLNGTLTLTNGILNTSAINLLTISSTGTTTEGIGAPTNSFVNGPMQWNDINGAGPFIFPTGKDTVWARTSFSNISSSSSFQVEYFNTANINTTPIAAPITNISTKEYWQIDKINGTGNATITAYWENPIWSGINNCGELNLVLWNGSTWSNRGQAAIASTGCPNPSTEFGNISADTNATFGAFTFGFINIPLPIELINFRADTINNTQAILNWTTASEINNNYFTIQKTQNGTNYINVGIVKGGGNTSMINTYSLIDENPYRETSYYRLKQTDYDGKFQYSLPIPITIKKTNGINIFPNPVDTYLEYTIPNIATETIQVKIVDIVGRKVFETTETINANHTTHSINTNLLSKGVYILQITTPYKTIHQQFVK